MKKEDFLKQIENLLFSKKETFPDHVQGALSKKLQRLDLDSIFDHSEIGDLYKSYGENLGNLTMIIRDLESILQPKRKFDVVIPGLCIESFVKRIFDNSVHSYNKKLYKGVSYNPNLLRYGEKLDNLDFFSYLKVSGREAIIFDASCYHALNLMQKQKLSVNTRYSDFVCDVILECIESNKELNENSKLRKTYLNRMSKISLYDKAEVVSMQDVLLQNEAQRIFKGNLNYGLNFCEAHIQDQWLDLLKYVRYKRNDSWFAKLYTPLVLAESLYARNCLDCDTKLGPISETGFDSFISKMDKEFNFSPMDFVWYSRPFEKLSSPETSIYTRDSMDQVRKKLSSNPKYAEWLEDIISPFFRSLNPLEEKIEYLIKKIEH